MKLIQFQFLLSSVKTGFVVCHHENAGESAALCQLVCKNYIGIFVMFYVMTVC